MAITISGDSPNLTSASLTTPTLTSPTFAGTPSGSIITSGTAVASTSGTSIDFTSIPSWVKRVTVMLNGVSTNATGHLLIQLADSGTVRTSGYDSVAGVMASGGNTVVSSTAGFIMYNSTTDYTQISTLTLTLQTGTTWMGTIAGKTTYSGPTNSITGGGGSIALSAALDRVRITSVSGTAVFDAGSINILYE